MEWRNKILTMAGFFLTMLTLGLVWTGQTQVMAAQPETGSMIIELDDLGTSRDSVGFTAYFVGEMNDGQWELTENLQSTGIDLNSLTYADEWDVAALKLARAATSAELTSFAGKTGSSGTMTLADIPAGIYLVVQNDGEKTYGTVSPFMAAVPMLEEGVWKDTVTVYPKAETPPGEAYGRIEVTKRAGYLDPELLEIVDLIPKDAVYYVGIFRDEQGKVPYGIDYIREIHIQGESTGKASFEQLAEGTYYVFETDSNGNPVVVDEVQRDGTNSWVCQLEEGSSQKVELEGTEDATEGYVGFYNLYYELPKGFAYKAEIDISKYVLRGDTQITADDTFYAGIFLDEAATELWGLVELKQNDTVTVEVPLGGENGDEPITYYVYETDENGEPVNKDGFAYTVAGEGKAEFRPGKPKEEIRITNTEKIVTVTPTPTEGPVVTPTPGTPITPEGSTTTTSVRTGDDTPVALYLAVAAAALLIFLASAVYLRRSGKHEQKK